MPAICDALRLLELFVRDGHHDAVEVLELVTGSGRDTELGLGRLRRHMGVVRDDADVVVLQLVDDVL